MAPDHSSYLKSAPARNPARVYASAAVLFCVLAAITAWFKPVGGVILLSLGIASLVMSTKKREHRKKVLIVAVVIVGGALVVAFALRGLVSAWTAGVAGFGEGLFGTFGTTR